MENPFHLTESREVYRGRLMRIREDHVVLPRGTHAVFNVAEIKSGSTVLALDDELRVNLIREYKWAVNRLSLEAISGGMDEGETPLDCARRELREEGGLEAVQWTELGMVDPFTSHVVSPNYMFLARGLSKVATQHEEGEVIHNLQMPLERAVEMAISGEITHAASVVAILKTARLVAAGA
jgi:ADP-ribose pyrophosphatase